jgi:hypothetical protein
MQHEAREVDSMEVRSQKRNPRAKPYNPNRRRPRRGVSRRGLSQSDLDAVELFGRVNNVPRRTFRCPTCPTENIELDEGRVPGYYGYLGNEAKECPNDGTLCEEVIWVA